MNATKKLVRTLCATVAVASMTCTGAFGLYGATVTGSDVNLRASENGNVMRTLSQGTQVAVISNTNDMYRVAVDGMTGYISGQYIKGMPDADFALGTATVACETSVNLRAQPGTESEVLQSLSNGALIWVAGIQDGWYKVTVDGVTGFISDPYVNINSRMETSTDMVSRDASGTASALRQQVLDYAATFLGTAYVYGGSSPSGFDCSGFTSYVYKNTVRSIPRTATAQHNALTDVTMDNLLPGDLVFFGSGSSITHTGIYVGGGEFIHSPHTGSSVKYDTLWSGNYKRRFVSGGRVIFD